MFSAAAKMSLEASDVQTDEDCEELVEDGFLFSADFLEKKTRRKRSSVKHSPSPRSPYLSSMSVNPRRAAVVAAWRLPRASLGDTRGETTGESVSARLTSLSNGHDLSQTLRSECDVTPELLKQTLSMKKHKHHHSAANGFTFGADDHRDKEGMYDEIIRLKKSLLAQKSDNQQLKVKLRRLEEDNAKREKQIEELLDPTKGSDYTRSLVDKKKEGSVVLNGLRQRILKLEQQCREKENALSKLQSELRTTNLEELKITVETYSEEIQRLRLLLEAAEKSSRAESKCSQRQQKALSSMVHRLSESVKRLQQENTTLREELNTDSPAGGIKGYREWSKQRLLRRLLELEKRPADGRRHAPSGKSSGRLDQEAEATPAEILRHTMATEAAVSVGTNTEDGEENSELSERLGQSEKERVELQEMLSSKDDELRQSRTDREELEKETERWKAEQMNERDQERLQHKQELEQLWTTIRTLEEKHAADLSAGGDHEDSPRRSSQMEREEREAGDREEEGGRNGDLENIEKKKKRSEMRQHKARERAARIIQANWRQHRHRDIVMLQSALKGHLLRASQLQDLLKDTQKKAVEATAHGDEASSVAGEMDEVALTIIQSAIRGHLARSSFAKESSGFSVPSPMGNSLPKLEPRRPRSTSRTGAASLHIDKKKQGDEEEEGDLWPVPSRQSSRSTPTTDQTRLHCTAETGGAAAAAVDSDDSDDIIVSPSRPLRSREVLIS